MINQKKTPPEVGRKLRNFGYVDCDPGVGALRNKWFRYMTIVRDFHAKITNLLWCIAMVYKIIQWRTTLQSLGSRGLSKSWVLPSVSGLVSML